MSYDRSAIVADYQAKWDAMVPTRPAETDAAAKRIVANWAEYKAVEAATGVPAYFVGVLHMRECGNDMHGCLHNGELIIGTKRKTRLEPPGRGPFKTFFDSALDALEIQGFRKVTDWSPAVCCWEGERFNGLGYRMHGVAAAYVLGGTQFYRAGKFVHDGASGWRPNFVDPQLGIAPVMKRVLELAADKSPSLVGRIVAKRAEKVAVAKDVAPRLHRWDGYLDYVGLGSVSLGTLLNQLGAFVIDWRTLAVLGAGGSLWLGVKWVKWQAVAASAADKGTAQ